MTYVYPITSKYNQVDLRPQLDAAASRLHQKLLQVHLTEIGISEYNQSKIAEYLANPIANFQLFNYLIELSLFSYDGALQDFVCIDYGGGSGVLSLLAKELGIGTVIYNDIYDVSCKDIELLSKALNLDVDHIVHGDIDAVIRFVQKHSLGIHAITSRDVIEHIYDIETFLEQLALLSAQPFRVVMSTGANTKNPRVRRDLVKTHMTSEYQNREKQWGHKERDALQSYLDIRKQIIQEYDDSLPADVVDELASKTRGLMKTDIEACVDDYRQTGTVTYEPHHPTNTCDPYTGNWAERLMDIRHLESVLEKSGFDVKTLGGFYSSSVAFHKKLVKAVLNTGIKHLGKAGLYVAPFIILTAVRKHVQIM